MRFLGLNPDLFVPMFLTFILLRMKNTFNLAKMLINGIKFFMKKRVNSTVTLATTASDQGKNSEERLNNIIDKCISQLQLTMVQVNSSLEIDVMLKSQLFFTLYETCVYMCIVSILSFLWTTGFHCAEPEDDADSWMIATMMVITATISLQSLLQIWYLTGMSAREAQIGLITGISVFIIVLALQFSGFPLFSVSTVTSLAEHTNALYLQVSRDAKALQLTSLVNIVTGAIALLIGSIAMILVIPALHFAKTLQTLCFGKKYEKAAVEVRVNLWMDFFSPLVVCFFLSSLPKSLFSLIYSMIGQEGSNGKSVNVFEQYLLLIQIFMVLTFCKYRLGNMKVHLQAFMDSVINTVAVSMINQQYSTTSLTILQEKVQLRANYLVAAAIQYVSVPSFALMAMLLIHRYSSYGTGVCEGVHAMLKTGKSKIVHSIATQRLEFNPTKFALAATQDIEYTPYLVDAILALLGFVPTPKLASGEKGPKVSAAKVLQSFLLRVSKIATPPVAVAADFLSSLLLVFFLLYFCINLFALLGWMYAPELLLNSKIQKKTEVEATKKDS